MTTQYRISAHNPHRQFVSFEATFPNHGAEKMKLQLPAWRPGRYELGNFARNIRGLVVHNAVGEPLPFRKITKDCWEVESRGTAEVILTYQYYAAELNAGSSWLDETQLYLNPVNCFFFNPLHPESSFDLQFDLPADFEIATGLSQPEKHQLHARDVQQLMDCPLIAAPDLVHWTYRVDKVLFHIWFKGNIKLNQEKLIKEFSEFTSVQMAAFGSFPVSEYHFLFQAPDFPVRHGVEHENSTVIAIGPPELLATKQWYDELIGISSHELYHTWNVKALRPADMMPYDFTRENYSRLGYVAEGVTTYMGDKMLLKSGYFSEKEFLTLMSETLQKHMDNPGRFNLSVADSSIDTWLDGYQPGIPWRKVSIYNEGCLTAFITDVLICLHSKGQHTLDTVMRELYDQFGLKKKGYTEQDYREAVTRAAGRDLPEVFDQLIHGTEDYFPLLAKCCDLLGWQIKATPAPRYTEAHWGMRLENNRITLILPDSPADQAGLWVGDMLMSIDNRVLEGDCDAAARHMGSGQRILSIKRHGKLKIIKLKSTTKVVWPQLKLEAKVKLSNGENQRKKNWL